MIQSELKKFFESEDGKRILIDLINEALVYEVKWEKTDESGRTEIVVEEQNAIQYILWYISRTEGAVRGCQKNAAEARNRAAQSLVEVRRLNETINRLSSFVGHTVVDVTPVKKELTE